MSVCPSSSRLPRVPSRRAKQVAPPRAVESLIHVVMLSAVLNTARAVEMSVFVVSAFVRMRELIAANKYIAARVEKLERGHDRTGVRH